MTAIALTRVETMLSISSNNYSIWQISCFNTGHVGKTLTWPLDQPITAIFQHLTKPRHIGLQFVLIVFMAKSKRSRESCHGRQLPQANDTGCGKNA